MWLQQPEFGQRLRALRLERCLSQQQVAGADMSKAYVSRLESGVRPPTTKAVDHLCKRLDVPPSIFEQARPNSISEALARVSTTDDADRAIAMLERSLAEADDGQQTAGRWQALQLLAAFQEKSGRREDQLQTLLLMVQIAETMNISEASYYSQLKLARAVRSQGDMVGANASAYLALDIAVANDLAPEDVAHALLVVVSTQSAIGNLAEAEKRAAELQKITVKLSPVLRAQSLWTAAHVCLRQNDFVSAAAHLDAAVELLDSRDDLDLWLRLRLAAAALNMEMSPRRLEEAQRCLSEAASAVRLIGSPLHQQEFMLLSAQLAMHQGDLERARELNGQLAENLDLLAYQDQVAAHVLHNQLRILEGDREHGIAALLELAENAERKCNADLAKEIWRTLAETLARSGGT